MRPGGLRGVCGKSRAGGRTDRRRGPVNVAPAGRPDSLTASLSAKVLEAAGALARAARVLSEGSPLPSGGARGLPEGLALRSCRRPRTTERGQR